MIRCPNCGSEAIEDRVLGRAAGASRGFKYIMLAVITGGLFFVLVLVLFLAMGYLNRFVVSFVRLRSLHPQHRPRHRADLDHRQSLGTPLARRRAGAADRRAGACS